MKTTIVIYGSSTGSCQSIAETIASKLGVEAVDVANIDYATISSHENVLLGTSTWGAGEMQDDWYDGVKTLKSAGLAGKTVALLGLVARARGYAACRLGSYGLLPSAGRPRNDGFAEIPKYGDRYKVLGRFILKLL